MSLSNKCIPPEGIVSIMKSAPLGVGTTGMDAAAIFRCLIVDAELPASKGSVEELDSIFFKLDDEKFFLKVPGPTELLLISRAGDSGIKGTPSSLSPVVTLYSEGIGGNGLDVVSVELGGGIGDDPFRASGLELIAMAGEIREEVWRVWCEGGIAKADLGGSVNVDVESGASTDGSCVLGAVAIGAKRTLAFVSILSCGALMPESLLSRTPGLLLRDTGGAPVGSFIGWPFTVDIGRLGKAPEGGG